MRLSIVAALSDNKVIGLNNQLPWHMPADLKRFKALTLNKPVIMGRKTYESIGKPLPKRDNIIITRNADYRVDGCQVLPSLNVAMAICSQQEEVMIMGGASIYTYALPLTERMYLTLIHTTMKGDTFFPEWRADEWQETAREEHLADNKNIYDYSFVTLERLL